MRLWSLHPKHLDAKGLVAAWREALLARAVLRGETRGYRHHPQLVRFRAHARPQSAIDADLAALYREAQARGYRFDASKFARVRSKPAIEVTSGQVAHEWRHLLAKLRARSPADYRRCKALMQPDLHPLFHVVEGPVEAWERMKRERILLT